MRHPGGGGGYIRSISPFAPGVEARLLPKALLQLQKSRLATAQTTQLKHQKLLTYQDHNRAVSAYPAGLATGLCGPPFKIARGCLRRAREITERLYIDGESVEQARVEGIGAMYKRRKLRTHGSGFLGWA